MTVLCWPSFHFSTSLHLLSRTYKPQSATALVYDNTLQFYQKQKQLILDIFLSFLIQAKQRRQ